MTLAAEAMKEHSRRMGTVEGIMSRWWRGTSVFLVAALAWLIGMLIVIGPLYLLDAVLHVIPLGNWAYWASGAVVGAYCAGSSSFLQPLRNAWQEARDDELSERGQQRSKTSRDLAG